MDPINVNSGRHVRILTGTPAQVEDQLNALVPTYVAWQWRWDVVDRQHLLSVVMLLASDLERAMRMQMLAQGTVPTGRPQ
jgi:hypothetical protein